MRGALYRPLLLLLAAAACGESTEPGDGGIGPTSGTIVGAVTDASGAPLGVVEIATDPASGTALTAADGTYRLDGIPPGTYEVRGTKSAYRAGQKAGVAVTAGGTAYADLRLEAEAAVEFGSVRVTVTDDAADSALVGATVRLDPTGRTQVSGANGEVLFRQVEAGAYTVSATREGYLAATATALTAVAGEETTAALALAPVPTTGTISGRITDAADHAGVPGATVTTEPATTPATTTADGTYELAGLAPGSYRIHAAMAGFHEAVSEVIVVTAGGSATADLSLTALPTYASTCEACHLVRETLVADLAAYPPPGEGGEPGSTGEG
jgi:uncharacterized surface anchored protein